MLNFKIALTLAQLTRRRLFKPCCKPPSKPGMTSTLSSASRGRQLECPKPFMQAGWGVCHLLLVLFQVRPKRHSLAASLPGARSDRGTQRLWTCFGCGGPHPYSEYCPNNGHVVICPNHDSPGVRENANKNIEKMRKNRKKQHVQNTKRKNLGTANLSDFDNQGRQQITEQVLQSMNRQDISEHSSVTSLVSTPRSVSEQGMQCGCGHGRGLGRGVILVTGVVVLAAGLPLKRACPFQFKVTSPAMSFSLVPIWTAPTAYQFAVPSICMPPS